MALGRKGKRSVVIGIGLAGLALAIGLVLYALNDTIVFFYTPSDVAEKSIQPGQRFRLGGLVEKGSIAKGADAKVGFAITDTDKSIKVTYQGILPDLFREGEGVIAEGRLDDSGMFVADSVLAKHDETYMPPEVAEALKEKGVWRGDEKSGGS
ncbi:MAG: cytochrome c maturation protein CcmE [Hyphomicrobiaceae bacterium]